MSKKLLLVLLVLFLIGCTATEIPTLEPTEVPTLEPTEIPTPEPTSIPTPIPTLVPTLVPTKIPTVRPIRLQVKDIVSIVEKTGPVLENEFDSMDFDGAEAKLLVIFMELFELEVSEELDTLYTYSLLYVSELIESCQAGQSGDIDAATEHLKTATIVIKLMTAELENLK